LETETGLPLGMGLPGRVAQIMKQMEVEALENAQEMRIKKWMTIPTACPCPSKLDSGIPPAKGLPRRSKQVAVDVVAAAVDHALAVSTAAMAASASAANSGSISEHGHEQCTICLEEARRQVELPCGHIFCADCLLRLVSKDRLFQNRACPVCRGQLFDLPEDQDKDAMSENGHEDTLLWRWSKFIIFSPDSSMPVDFFVYCSCSKPRRDEQSDTD